MTIYYIYLLYKNQIFGHINFARWNYLIYWLKSYKKLIVKIIIWLWNPWLEYAKTRHNVWFMFLDFLKEKLGFEDFKDSKFKALILEWIMDWEKVILMKPMTYMNLSWESISALVNFYKLDSKEDIFIIYDDISMDFGKVRFRDKWSAGWHNGIKSTIEKLGSEQFKRLKIWVWLDSKFDVSDWVLSKFTSDEIKTLENEIFDSSLDLLKEKIN